jgi:hypothetical protein
LGGADKAWSSAFTRICVKCELRNHNRPTIRPIRGRFRRPGHLPRGRWRGARVGARLA